MGVFNSYMINGKGKSMDKVRRVERMVAMTKLLVDSPQKLIPFPLAVMVARAFNKPLVIARRDSKVTEGSAISINYVTGSSGRIQTMTLTKRAIPPNARVLIIDDFMKAGGTAKGLKELVLEMSGVVVGTGVLVATAEPNPKLIDDYESLFTFYGIDENTKKISIEPVFDEE